MNPHHEGVALLVESHRPACVLVLDLRALTTEQCPVPRLVILQAGARGLATSAAWKVIALISPASGFANTFFSSLSATVLPLALRNLAHLREPTEGLVGWSWAKLGCATTSVYPGSMVISMARASPALFVPSCWKIMRSSSAPSAPHRVPSWPPCMQSSSSSPVLLRAGLPGRAFSLNRACARTESRHLCRVNCKKSLPLGPRGPSSCR